MILSQKELEEMAAAVTMDFNRTFFGSAAERLNRFAFPTPIDQLASDYLGLNVTFAKLSADGSIYGLTAYADAEFSVETDGAHRILSLKRNQVVLDSSFMQPGNIRRLCYKRRFTLAHECAHQLLFQMESDERKISCYAKPGARGYHTLKTPEDWREWQANTLGAAILMPQNEVDRAMWYLNTVRPLISYDGMFYGEDRNKIKVFCSLFGVSKTTASIRLNQLGYLITKQHDEYMDPAEVWS